MPGCGVSRCARVGTGCVVMEVDEVLGGPELILVVSRSSCSGAVWRAILVVLSSCESEERASKVESRSALEIKFMSWW